jgi:hypothetical protein
MRAILAFLCFVLSVAQAEAQIADRQQKKDWAYLFKLSQDIKELENCIYFLPPAENKDKWWEVYHRRVHEYVAENDDYIKKYAGSRNKTETEDDFRFRVWASTLEVGKEQARKVEQTFCNILIAVEK